MTTQQIEAMKDLIRTAASTGQKGIEASARKALVLLETEFERARRAKAGRAV